MSDQESVQNRELRGRIVANAVGAVLLNQMQGISCEVFYWKKGNHKVDCILKAAPFLVGRSGMSLEEVFKQE